MSKPDKAMPGQLESIVRPLLYLAVPYSHPSPEIRAERFRAANRAAGKLMADGHHVFSPISHTHPIAEVCELPKGWDYWEAFDRAYLQCCHKLIVLTLDGWMDSIGVTEEIRIAQEMGVPVEFMCGV